MGEEGRSGRVWMVSFASLNHERREGETKGRTQQWTVIQQIDGRSGRVLTGGAGTRK